MSHKFKPTKRLIHETAKKIDNGCHNKTTKARHERRVREAAVRLLQNLFMKYEFDPIPKPRGWSIFLARKDRGLPPEQCRAGLSISSPNKNIVFFDLRQKLNQKQEKIRVILARNGDTETRNVEIHCSESIENDERHLTKNSDQDLYFNYDLIPVTPEPPSPLMFSSHDEQFRSNPTSLTSAQEQNDVNAIALSLMDVLKEPVAGRERPLDTGEDDLRAYDLNGYPTFEDQFVIHETENEFAE
jgi:hypothetical protein